MTSDANLDPMTGFPVQRIRIEEFIADPQATLDLVIKSKASFEITQHGDTVAYLLHDFLIPDED